SDPPRHGPARRLDARPPRAGRGSDRLAAVIRWADDPHRPHRPVVRWHRPAMTAILRPIRDVVAPDLRLLFVGINPGLRSAEVGHHFAGRTNPFWRLLHAAGLTSELLAPEEDRRLLDDRLGVTNLCRRPTRSASELGLEERRRGA